MSDEGLTPPEEARVQRAADEAFHTLTGRTDYPAPPPRERLSNVLRRVTIEAPLQALAVAFLLGVLIARRR